MKKSHLPLFVLIVITMHSCNWFKSETPKEIELNAKSETLVASNNEFGYSFFEKIVQTEDRTKNIMVSPLSVSQALSMAINGAGGNTYTQMQQVLGFSDFSLLELNESNRTISGSLVGHDPKVKMEVANSVWYRDDFVPKTSFIDNNQLYYSAEVSSFDATQPDKAKTAINNWVNDKTHGKIDEIIDEVKAEDLMFLINAIYFKAKWKTEFKKSDTEDALFTLDNGTEKMVPTMNGKVKLAYENKEKFTIIKLPYGSGKFNMYIYLPEEGYTTGDIAGEIEKTDFGQMSNLVLSERELRLPKFEFSYDNMLIDELSGMGMTDAFDPALADLSGISDLRLYISEVMHKTYIKTDEEGTEAAAVTSVTVGLTSVGPEGIIKVDRSFLFAIVEEDTQSILFVGRVYDPIQSN